ncbi:MAG: hypothetical protein M1826_002683 [Phylliscum demangeonii]|nr:MAG: hypothetical protein M1826_002683 [Phylliscum demangeonii]
MSVSASADARNGDVDQSSVPLSELDVPKLHALPSEQQDLCLLSFSASLAHEIESAPEDGLSARQATYKKEILKILSLSSPPPTRAIRRNLGRSFAGLFNRGDRKLLYESTNELLAVINSGKAEKTLITKHAALHCLGRAYEVAGDGVVALSGHACMSVIRLHKAAQNDAGLRSSVFRALGSIFGRIGTSVDEAWARDTWRLGRGAASTDKSHRVQRSALCCLEQLAAATPFFNNASDFDSLKSTVFKAFESPAPKVRHAGASGLATVLIKSFTTETSTKSGAKAKRTKKTSRMEAAEPDGDDAVEVPGSTSAKKAPVYLKLSLPEILKHLSTQYVRTSTSNRGRAGLAICYIRVLKGIGQEIVDTQYMTIVDHLLTDLLSQPSVVNNRYRLLMTRKFVRVILEDVVGQDILGETAQLGAAKTLVNDVLKNYPPVIKERAEPTKYAITGALSALASLLRSLAVLRKAAETVSFKYCNILATQFKYQPHTPIYGSMELNMGVSALANELLKTSGESELRTAATQIQVAWILLGSLMTFGPSFVKPMLPQLIFLWRNALPKPAPKESMGRTSSLELSFLAHVRECALGCMLAFFAYNSKILTVDLVRRIAGLLQNTTSFLNHLPAKRNTDDISQRLSPSLQLYDYDQMVRRRMFEAYTVLLRLSPAGGRDALLQPELLTLAVSMFAHPEDYMSPSLSASIASSAGSFDSIWEVGDNHGFGVTGLLHGLDFESGLQKLGSENQGHWLTGIGPEATIDNTSATIQESILEQLVTFMSAPSLQRDPARRAAIEANIALALLAMLKVAVKETSFAPGDVTSPAAEKISHELLRLNSELTEKQGLIVHPDVYVRNIACEAMARLCSSSGNAFLSSEINRLIEVIVSNREPNARAGCSVALGCVHSHVGSMAAGYHVKTILGVLLSLSDDPHPLVHFWALEALQKVVDSSGLSFSGYVSSTLGMLAQRYFVDSHNEETPALAFSNLEFEFPTMAITARCLDSLVNVLGPDLAEAKKVRDLIFTLVAQLQLEPDPLVVVGSLRCLEHISIYATRQIDYSAYVHSLQTHLEAAEVDVRDEAIDGLYNLMKLDVDRLIRSTRDGLEEQLWMTLDKSPGHACLQSVIKTWLRQTWHSDAGVWIQRCQRALNQTRAKLRPSTSSEVNKIAAGPDLQDEEVAGFAATSNAEQESSTMAASGEQELLKWQVRAFAMECLSELLAAVAKEMASSAATSSAAEAIQAKVGDIIRMAFIASTAHVVQLRIWGLRIIYQILKMFGKTPDPDFPEASLLDQYQAQISSALTPAFAADSTPELASEAIEVCAAFIATGIVKDVDRELKFLGSNAQAMLKVAVISAWAGLQVASEEQRYLVDVVRPHIEVLTPLWLSCLREYARLRFGPDNFSTSSASALSGDVDLASADLDRAVILKFYKGSWLKLLQAITSLVEENINIVFDALDGKSGAQASSGKVEDSDELNYRDEPVAFFFVLFGIIFEALSARSRDDADDKRSEILELILIMKKLLRPSISGQAIYQDTIFSEMIDLLNRLVLTQGLEVQGAIVDLAGELCLSHPSSRGIESTSIAGDALTEDVEQLFELTRIIVMVLAGLLPNLGDPQSQVTPPITSDAALLIRTALETLVGAAEVFPTVIRGDLYACIFHIFATLLGTAACQQAVVPPVLSILKQFVQTITAAPPGPSLPHHSSPLDSVDSGDDDDESTIPLQLRSCLRRFLSILAHTQAQAQARQQSPSETAQSVSCVKNTLLACTILLTSGPRKMTLAVATTTAMDDDDDAGGSSLERDALIDRLLDALVGCLSDGVTAKVASRCLRSLLLHTPRGPVDAYIVQRLLPPLIAYIVADPPTPAPALASADVLERSDADALITSSLVALVTTSQLPVSTTAALLALLIPALLHRRRRAAHPRRRTASDPDTDADTRQWYLELARAHPSTFRQLLLAAPTALRTDAEALLRGGAGAGPHANANAGAARAHAADRPMEEVGAGAEEEDEDEGGKKPSIALKMDFLG